ncbi:ABC transporter permease [Acholeplasma laidlawii]|uniref:ABC-type transport system, permease component n=1 Tax=Acholeplasma laidlawii (strain PG-8A) TaxID=441768 RepID=A9NHP9_ACHLI|nr:ABC transporter permease [Acholeplasma laidlawii]ABX81879.1 ABC-type transport system, permease component [Acholeplasma laidlawii PG-8A]RED19304.1 ABC-type spermidine/putrescine transport system permease subunit I [Acholeplasma laidlawii]SQH57470.1 Putrescine transport system permease protein PotH [Acholeplasma laidlawii]
MKKPFSRLSTPYIVWLFILALIPIVVMLFLSVTTTQGLSLDGLTFNSSFYQAFFERSITTAFFNSIYYAILTTVISLLLGYLVAYTVFRSKFKNKFLVLAIFILPMWSNLLLRTESLGNLMNENNLITDILSKLLNTNVSFPVIKGSGLAVVIGLVLTYLPFMILPIYTALEKIDYSLEEAALDLGLTDLQKFMKVVLPLSLKGVATGSILVFLPAMSGFAIPEILGSGNILLIGNIIEQSFRYMDYNLGSLLSIMVLLIIFLGIFVVAKVDKEGEMLL